MQNGSAGDLTLPVKENDLPDFLQLQHRPQGWHQSPVMQRNLRDPDLTVMSTGLMIPDNELEVPDFLLAKTPKTNGKFVQVDVNHHPRMSNGVKEHNQSRARDPGYMRETSTFGMHSSNDNINMESDSYRHTRMPADNRPYSPPLAHGKVVTKIMPNSTQRTQTMVHHSTNDLRSRENLSKSRDKLYRSSESLHKSKESMHKSNDNVVDLTDGMVDDFGDFTLKRKYKKPAKNSSTNQMSDIDKFAPGVTGRHAVNFQKKSPSGNINTRKPYKTGNIHLSGNDSDSIPSTSSQSFTETLSPRRDQKQPREYITPRQDQLGVHPPHFGLDSNESESATPGSHSNQIGESSMGYQDSSLDDSGHKVTRKNSLQAHLRRKIQEYERSQKQQTLAQVRYDSDTTTISEPSAFSEGNASVTRTTQHGKCPSAINNLPEDLLLNIFSYLTTPELCLASGVCCKWQYLCWDPVLWTSIKILNHQNSDINRVLRNTLTKLGSNTQGYCLTVRSIKLNGSELVSDKGLGCISRFCIDLEHLELIGCCCVTSKGIQEVLMNCSSLRHLNVAGCSCLNSICPPSFNGFSITENGQFLKLRHLDLSDCVAFDDMGLRTVGLSCGLLENLYLRRCTQVTDVGIRHIANNCRQLKELSTSDCYKVRDFSLKEIAKNIPTLKYLSVAKCPVSDTGIKYIGRYCVHLKYLNVRGCEAVTDAGIAFVVQNCLKLRSLDIGKCAITDSALNTIGIHCPQLKKLSMKGCDRVSVNGIKCIANQCCNIQYLNVQECNLDYDTFVYIRKHCRSCIIEHTCPAFF
ncbi:F-box/LRR-repeat protein 15-like isoform X2 [Nematostella vectensis]|nr:F-box/LRR-repeat protein 15-like isoform X2 [Nematostella vectensis]